MATTTTIDGCDAAMADVFAFMSTFFDRVDVDPEGILANEDELGELFAESGKATGEGCLGSEDEALSALLIFLANEAVERERVTAAFIAGMLSSFCEGLTGYDLSLEARAACAAS